MRNKKIIILIVVLVSASVSLIYGITASSKGKAKAVYTNAGAETPQAPVKAVSSTHRRAKRSEFTSWKRNPFAPSGTTAAPALVLNGIMWNKTNPTAMVGDTIVKKGDRIGNNTVVGIMPDKVVLNDGTKDVELKMPQ